MLRVFLFGGVGAMIRLYFDSGATQVVRDSIGPTDGQPDAYEGPGAGGEVTAQRWLFNPNATRTYEGVTIRGFQDDEVTNLQYALDDGLGAPGVWEEVLALSDGAYDVPFLIHVRVVFAATPEPLRRTDVRHWIQAQKELLV